MEHAHPNRLRRTQPVTRRRTWIYAACGICVLAALLVFKHYGEAPRGQPQSVADGGGSTIPDSSSATPKQPPDEATLVETPCGQVRLILPDEVGLPKFAAEMFADIRMVLDRFDSCSKLRVADGPTFGVGGSLHKASAQLHWTATKGRFRPSPLTEVRFLITVWELDHLVVPSEIVDSYALAFHLRARYANAFAQAEMLRERFNSGMLASADDDDLRSLFYAVGSDGPLPLSDSRANYSVRDLRRDADGTLCIIRPSALEFTEFEGWGEPVLAWGALYEEETSILDSPPLFFIDGAWRFVVP